MICALFCKPCTDVRTDAVYFYLQGKGSFDSDTKDCSSTEKLLETESSRAVSSTSELHQPITTAPSATNAAVEVETEPVFVQDKAIPKTDPNERSPASDQTTQPIIGQCSIPEKSTAELGIINPTAPVAVHKSERKRGSRHERVRPYKNQNVIHSGSLFVNNVKLKTEADQRRHQGNNINEAVIITTGDHKNNVCIGYRHVEPPSIWTGDTTTSRRSIVEAVLPSVHGNGSYSSTTGLQQAATTLSYPAAAKEAVRTDTQPGRSGISSIHHTALINASITNTTPNSFAQPKQTRALIATSKSILNERSSDAPDTQSDDVCLPVAKATWNNLPDSQITQISRWQPVKRNASSGNVDSLPQDNRTSGSHYSSPRKSAESRIVPVQRIIAGRRRIKHIDEEWQRRYSAPTTSVHDSHQPNVPSKRVSIETSRSICDSDNVRSNCVCDQENNIVKAKIFHPELAKCHSLDYDTLNMVPAGSKNQVTMDHANTNCVPRRARPPIPRGSSACEAQSEAKIDQRRGQTGRPKSAEFLLDDVVQKTPRLVRSPSDGDKTLLLALENNNETSNENQDKDNDTPTEKNQGFLRKMFTFTRRSRSRENKEPAKPVKTDDSSQRSRSLTGSRSRSPSTRSRSPSNTSSIGSAESYNNNSSASSVDNRLSLMRNSRRYLSIHNEIDENRNIEAPSPPIAVWSSDEDISSAPSTPRRKSHAGERPGLQKVVFRKYSDYRDPRLLKTISPELEEQISASLREPPKIKRDASEIAQGEAEGLGVTRYRGSPRRCIPSQSLKRYAVSRHQGTEAPPQAPLVSSHISVRQPPRGPLLQYTRLKNHTFDQPQVKNLDNPLDKENNDREPSVLHRKHSSGEQKGDSTFVTTTQNARMETSFGCVPQSSTSTAPCFSNLNTTDRSTCESHPAPEQSDYSPRKGIVTRTSWGRCSQLSPADKDTHPICGLVENVSTDSGIQQDSYESSNESIKVSATQTKDVVCKYCLLSENVHVKAVNALLPCIKADVSAFGTATVQQLQSWHRMKMNKCALGITCLSQHGNGMESPMTVQVNFVSMPKHWSAATSSKVLLQMPFHCTGIFFVLWAANQKTCILWRGFSQKFRR